MSLYPYEHLAWFHAVDTSLQTQCANNTVSHKYTHPYTCTAISHFAKQKCFVKMLLPLYLADF